MSDKIYTPKEGDGARQVGLINLWSSTAGASV